MMTIDNYTSDQETLRELGSRLRRCRIDYPLTQAELATRAGVSVRTVANIERGADVSMGTIIRVLRVLNLLSRVDLLAPKDEPRPAEIFQAKRRQRVRAKKSSGHPDSEWKWGDEQ